MFTLDPGGAMSNRSNRPELACILTNPTLAETLSRLEEYTGRIDRTRSICTLAQSDELTDLKESVTRRWDKNFIIHSLGCTGNARKYNVEHTFAYVVSWRSKKYGHKVKVCVRRCRFYEYKEIAYSYMPINDAAYWRHVLPERANRLQDMNYKLYQKREERLGHAMVTNYSTDQALQFAMFKTGDIFPRRENLGCHNIRRWLTKAAVTRNRVLLLKGPISGLRLEFSLEKGIVVNEKLLKKLNWKRIRELDMEVARKFTKTALEQNL
jgi:hypothetical protein